MASSVLLPQPLGPITVRNSPGRASSETSRRAGVSRPSTRKVLLRFRPARTLSGWSGGRVTWW